MRGFPFYKQQDQMDCGPTCLRMVCSHYGRKIAIQKLRALCYINRGGVNLLAISEAAEKIGLRSTGVKLSLNQLKEAELPCILHWRQNHFVVLYKIKKGNYYLVDPGSGLVTLPEDTFKKQWFSHKEMSNGISLLLSPSPQFYEQDDDKDHKISWLTILRYFYAYRQLFVQLAFGLGIGT